MSARRRSSNISRNDGAADDGAGIGGQKAQQQEEAVTNIKVAVRCRPFSTSERSREEKSCFRIENGTACLQNPLNPGDVHRFGFDLIYGGDSEQISLWKDVGVPAMEKAFAGFNTTIFAYGQTGSGKTFSMQGVGGGSGEGAGIIPRMNEELFARVTREREADANKMFLVTCSYFEIYNEVVYDLLDPNNRKRKGAGLEIREHGVLGIYVKGLQEMVVTSPDSMQRLIDQGMASRTVGSTAMNDTSSRSHSVFTVKVHQKDSTDESKSTFAKINLVDLAGSERAKSTGATGARLKEGANINKSLSSLGNVINALVDVANGKKGVFVPYRNSKLTRVLQESLGGNSLTAMLAALSPAACNFEETLSTLKYASRAKSIKVNAVKNEEASQVSRLEEEIRALKQKLQAQQQQQQEQTASSTFSFASPSAVSGAASIAVSPGGVGVDAGGVAAGTGLVGGRGGDGSEHGGAGGDRYKQQIAEMEAAMRSTWEEKAKQSESSEKERQRLQQQLAEEARREERERKKRWRALEDKGDLELSIREAKEVALPTLPARDWLGQVRALAAAENRAREEATVCAVYREALARELEGVFSGDRFLAGSSSQSGHFGGGDPEDDRASVASTACTAISESDSTAAPADGDGSHRHEGTCGAAGEGSGGAGNAVIQRGTKCTSSYDPVLLRQLQARLTSLTDARERLHGPLAKAVQVGSKKLLESVDAFAAKFSASPHDHVERRGSDAGGSRRGGAEVGGREAKAEAAAAAADAEGGGGEEMGKAVARKKRWEARKNEGARAIALIRRQVIARGRTTQRRQRRSSNAVGGEVEAEATANPADRQPSATAAGAAQAQGDSAAAATAPTSLADIDSAITSKAADCAALCPAAEVIASAVDAVLNGSTATFGSVGSLATPAAAAGVAAAVVDVINEESDAVDARAEIVEGAGEESQAERERYRDILERLSGAHGVLRKALDDATAYPQQAPSAVPSCDGEADARSGAAAAAPAFTSPGSKRRKSSDARVESIGEVVKGPQSEVAVPGAQLPPASQWLMRCSSGGSVEVDKYRGLDEDQYGRGRSSPFDTDHENNNGHDYGTTPSCSSNGDSFTWRILLGGEGNGREEEAGEGSEGDSGDKAGGASLTFGSWVTLDFGKTVAVAGLEIQPLQDSEEAVTAQQVRRLPRTPVCVAGYGIDDADGSIERTEAMVGEVMGGWGGILKSTPPAKLLSRPPVRFLYDLFRAVAKATGFGEDEACRSNWEDLSGKKDKIRLMDGMIKKVVDSLALKARPAKGSDIVMGQECAATNTFLQLLALAARAERDSRETHNQEAEEGQQQQDPHRLRSAGEDGPRPLLGKQAVGAGAVAAVATSADGVGWSEADFDVRVAGEVSDEGDLAIPVTHSTDCHPRMFLTLRGAPTATRCRHLRLSWPIGGNGACDSNSNAERETSSDAGTAGARATAGDGDQTAARTKHAAPAFGPGSSVSEHDERRGRCSGGGGSSRGYSTLRVRVVGEEGECEEGRRRARRGKVHPEEAGEAVQGEGLVVEDATGDRQGQNIGGVMEADGSEVEAQEQAAMTSLLEAMRSAVGRLLEQSLEWGRIEVANQERRTALRTNKMESLEKRLKASNEAKSRLAKDKKSMAVKAARAEEENLKLQEQVLRLRADVGRERVENNSLTERLAQAETMVEEGKSQMRELEAAKRNLECETEDLQNQVEVLTEERDVARSHEEDLFAKLTDRTDDLEALQESYVSLTDRWNDFQDEHDEVLEQLESFRATFKLSGNNSHQSNNNADNVVSRPTTSDRSVEAAVRRNPDGMGDQAWSAGFSGCDDPASQQHGEQQQQQQQQQQRGNTGTIGKATLDGEGEQANGGGSTRSSARPTSGNRSGHAPPRPASGRSVLARKTSISAGASGISPRADLRLRLGGGGGENGDTPSKPGSSPSPRRPPSLVSSVVPSPRHCSSPRMSGSVGDVSAVAASAISASQDSGGLRRRRSTQECAGFRDHLGGEGGRRDTAKSGSKPGGSTRLGIAHIPGDGVDSEEQDRVHGRNEDFPCERKETQRTRGDDSVEDTSRGHGVGGSARSGASCASPTASANPGLLHGGDSGGYYEDDFDDFLEEGSEEGEKRSTAPRDQETLRAALEKSLPTRSGSGEQEQRAVIGGSGSGDGGGGGHGSNNPPTEVVYRPPSGGSRGKGERPKSAARQGRSSSLNGAG